MQLLELKMNYSAFIKLRAFVKINDISAEIKEYTKKDDVVYGKLDVTGNYLTEDLVKTNTFSDEIPFSIIFSCNEYEIVDIDCVDLDYNSVEGRGIEIIFDVLIKYEDYSDEENVIEIPTLVDETKEYEKLKDETENIIDLKIEEELKVNDNNLPTLDEVNHNTSEELNLNDINIFPESDLETKMPDDNINIEKKKTIKICYYNESKDLDNLCHANDVGIDKVFNDNKNTDFVKYRRVIIK